MATEPRRMLGLDASAVPILYRVTATDEHGERIGDTTVYLCEHEVPDARVAAIDALAELGHLNVNVEYRPA